MTSKSPSEDEIMEIPITEQLEFIERDPTYDAMPWRRLDVAVRQMASKRTTRTDRRLPSTARPRKPLSTFAPIIDYQSMISPEENGLNEGDGKFQLGNLVKEFIDGNKLSTLLGSLSLPPQESFPVVFKARIDNQLILMFIEKLYESLENSERIEIALPNVIISFIANSFFNEHHIYPVGETLELISEILSKMEQSQLNQLVQIGLSEWATQSESFINSFLPTIVLIPPHKLLPCLETIETYSHSLSPHTVQDFSALNIISSNIDRIIEGTRESAHLCSNIETCFRIMASATSNQPDVRSSSTAFGKDLYSLCVQYLTARDLNTLPECVLKMIGTHETHWRERLENLKVH